MKKIETIFTHGEGELGIDSDANLYWNKKLVKTESEISFSLWSKILATLVSLSAIVIAVFTVLTYYYK